MEMSTRFEEFKASIKPRIKEFKFMLSRIASSPISMIGLALILFFVTIAILAPVLAPPNPEWSISKVSDPFVIPRPRSTPFPDTISPRHPFGLTSDSYDLYYGCIWGTITAFRVGIYVVAISLIISLVIGSLAGYYGGIVDEALMRFTDVILAVPGLVLAMAFIVSLPAALQISLSIILWIIAILFVLLLVRSALSRRLKSALFFAIASAVWLGWLTIFPDVHASLILLFTLWLAQVVWADKIFKNPPVLTITSILFILCLLGLHYIPKMPVNFTLISLRLTRLDKVLLALVLVGWPSYTRLLRGEILRVKNEDYIEAAKAAGASDFRVLWKHILPNSIYPLLVVASLDIGSIVITAASLSYLGLGAPAYYADWGQLVFRSSGFILYPVYWNTYVIPGMFIVLFCLGWNLLGDAFRDILDPTLRRR